MHHGNQESSDAMRKMFGPNEELGATGQFPDGKMSNDDEGEIKFAIAHSSEQVVVNLGKPVAWLAMSPQQAMDVADVLRNHAEQIMRRKNQVRPPK